jgi:hypothetical protein
MPGYEGTMTRIVMRDGSEYPAADDRALAAMGVVPTDWSVEAVRRLKA